MSAEHGYLIDSDVLITAKNQYYAFAICPGFWDSILRHHSRKNIHSIDRVKQELLRGKDDLEQWVRQSVPAGFFRTSDDPKVTKAYKKVISWINSHLQYSNADKKAEFAQGADGWLVAHGIATGKTVVTNEQPAPSSTKIKLPDVCDHFSVPNDNTFAMLKALSIGYKF